MNHCLLVWLLCLVFFCGRCIFCPSLLIFFFCLVFCGTFYFGWCSCCPSNCGFWIQCNNCIRIQNLITNLTSFKSVKMFTQCLISAHEITLNKHDYLNQLRTSSSFIYEKPTKIKLSSLTYILHLTQGDPIFNVTTQSAVPMVCGWLFAYELNISWMNRTRYVILKLFTKKQKSNIYSAFKLV